MPSQILEIVNQALARLGETPLSAAEYDFGLERHQLILREAVREFWEKTINLAKDDLKYYFELSTVTGQGLYALGFEPLELASTQLFLLDPSAGQDRLLGRVLEKDLLVDTGGDLANLPSGKPRDWFVAHTSLAGESRLGFAPIPDNIYTIRIYRQLAPAALSASSVLMANRLALSAMRHYLEWVLVREEGFSSAPDFERRFEEAWHEYIGRSASSEKRNLFQWPYQQS